MKPSKIVLSVFSLFLLLGHYGEGAQSSKQRGTVLAFIGPVISNESATEGLLQAQSKKARFGFTVGGGYELPLDGRMALQFRLLYTTGGGVYEYASFTMTARENSLEIPVLFKYKFKPRTGAFAMGGIYFGSLLSPAYVIKDELGTNATAMDPDRIRAFLYGLVVGFGYEISVKGLGLFGELAYKQGLTNVKKDEGGPLRLNTISLIAGVKF